MRSRCISPLACADVRRTTPTRYDVGDAFVLLASPEEHLRLVAEAHKSDNAPVVRNFSTTQPNSRLAGNSSSEIWDTHGQLFNQQTKHASTATLLDATWRLNGNSGEPPQQDLESTRWWSKWEGPECRRDMNVPNHALRDSCTSPNIGWIFDSSQKSKRKGQLQPEMTCARTMCAIS